MNPSLTGIILEELADFLRKRGAPSYRAKQITDWIYKKRVASFDAMTDLPNELRAQLTAEFDTPKTEVVRVLGSKDTTQKFLFRLRDQNLIESVLIPASPALYSQPSDRRTICVSSQVGCAYGCKFCASGLDGWTRNLDAGEIVQQLIAIEEKSGEKIDNVVFMGMGEPLANLKNVLRAIRIINASWGLEHRRAPHHHFDQRTRAANSRAGQRTHAVSSRPFATWRNRRSPQPDHAGE